MGWTSIGHPGLDFFKAVRLPLTKYAEISMGAASRLTIALSECKIGVCIGTSTASMRCIRQSPEGPAVSLGNDARLPD